MNEIIILVFLAATAFLLFSKKLAKSSNWNATLTPLASIMGSGFLVSAPLLAKQNKHSKSYFFIFLSIICFAVFIFGVPSG